MAEKPANSTAADGAFLLSIHIAEINVDKTLRVRSDLHLGGVMFKLVESLAITADWSDYALWWPERKTWLTRVRLTLDQCGVHADCRLMFTPMHKVVRVQLPDLQILELTVNFSVNVFNAVIQLAKDLGVRHPEELSMLKKPDRLNEGKKIKTINGSKERSPPGRSSAAISRSPSTLSNSLPRGIGGQRPTSPHLLTSTAIRMPRGGISATSSPQSTLLRSPTPLSPGSRGSWRDNWSPSSPLSRSLSVLGGGGGCGHGLVHSPSVSSEEAFVYLGRPKTFMDRAWINDGWLNSSRSLMEQGIVESDLIRLRFKYYDFYDLDPKQDAARINQIYEQAHWQLVTEEVGCTEEEMMMFAALQLQVHQQLQAGGDETDGLRRSDGGSAGDCNGDIDSALSDLQVHLEGSSVKNTADITNLPELQDYLRYFRPRKYVAGGTKRCWCVLRDMQILLFESKESRASGSLPLRFLQLLGCEMQPFVNVSQNRYIIKLFLHTDNADVNGGLSEEWLKCENVAQYARWMVACRLASEGHTMADMSYSSEVQSVEALLSMQQPLGPSPTLDPSHVSIEPASFVAQRFRKNRKPKQIVQKIIDAHANVRDMSLSEAKMNYIKAWRALPEYGITFFLVKFANTKKEELLGIAWNRLIRMDSKKGDIAKTYRFSALKAWNVQWEIKEMTVEFDEEKLSFRCLSADLKTVHEFIGGYIFLSLRSQDKNQTLNEEVFHKLTGGHT